MNNSVTRSPMFYVGDKYKLMPQLTKFFPDNIDKYIEPFVGGGSSFLNTSAKVYLVNDIDKNIIDLHKYLMSFADKPEALYSELFDTIEKYGLSCSYKGIVVPDSLKKKYVKTYYSHYNKVAYNKLKADYNANNCVSLLYLLLIYGFNHMIRFNSAGMFNLPVGNVDFNKNVYNAIEMYLKFVSQNKVKFHNMDYIKFVENISIGKDDFVYLDPPYLNSDSEYNKLWNKEEEIRLLKFLDKLDSDGVRFGITNLVNHKGKRNDLFIEWSKKYLVYDIHSNYISFNDNTFKENSKEVYVSNAERKI